MAEHAHTKTSIKDRMDNAHRVSEAQGERFTPLRAHVFELILNSEGAVKAYDLLDRLKPELGSPKPPTVYRALEFLSKLGLVHRVEALNAYIACDHGHNDHGAEFFVCETCNMVEESHAHAHLECAPNGFQIKRSVIEHYGICKACAA